MNCTIQENISLAPLTTLQVGGAARFFVEARDENEIIAALQFAADNNLSVFVLGGGSNLLVGDGGFDGLVLKIAARGLEFDNDTATAQAGENWDDFVKACVERDLSGVECLSGIPGSVGATPVQNVGAYGQEVADTIEAARVLDRRDLTLKTLTNADCRFAYRRSIFNTTRKNQFVVLSVTFRLRQGGKPNLAYKDLRQYFANQTHEPTLAETRAAVLAIRAAKSMVIDATDENRRSAGSFFKNPIVERATFDEIESSAGENVPHYAADDDRIKIPAAWLIEKSGFAKGHSHGRVGLSTKHTLAVVNLGDATAREIIEFVRHIQSAVRNRFNVELEPEPVQLNLE